MIQNNTLGSIKAKRQRRHRKDKIALIIIITAAVLIIAALIFAISYFTKALPASFYPNGKTPADSEGASKSSDDASQTSESETETPAPTEDTYEAVVQAAINEAEVHAAMYDYDAAIKTLSAVDGYESIAEVTELIASYETAAADLVCWPDNTQITHIFFHSLIYDTDLAFSSAKADNYNQNMVTMNEFMQILQNLYDKGYVLVSLHDIAEMQLQEDGSYVMVSKQIWLPEDKTPLVLSQDDVCYYEYMTGHGFASRLVLDENGNIRTEMDMEDGSTQVGAYDIIPLIDDFVSEHPDFSYHGAKGIVALTGYNGIFGYRTSEYSYGETNPDLYTNPNIEADRETAAEIAAALRDTGWEIASHSWGHPYLASCSWERFVWDCDTWQTEVASIVGDVDIMIFPFGEDVGSWRGYEDTNERYQYLKSLGFNYFCNVDSSVAWVQITGSYFRQGRRNIDGTRLYEAIVATDRLSDLFDAAEIFDPARPTPVPGVTASEAQDEE